MTPPGKIHWGNTSIWCVLRYCVTESELKAPMSDIFSLSLVILRFTYHPQCSKNLAGQNPTSLAALALFTVTAELQGGYIVLDWDKWAQIHTGEDCPANKTARLWTRHAARCDTRWHHPMIGLSTLWNRIRALHFLGCFPYEVLKSRFSQNQFLAFVLQRMWIRDGKGKFFWCASPDTGVPFRDPNTVIYLEGDTTLFWCSAWFTHHDSLRYIIIKWYIT